MESTAFYIFLFIHLVSLVTGFGAVIVIDFFGLLWLFKKVPLSLVNKVAGATQALIWLGWCGLVFSGLFLITIKGYIDNLTKIKLFFVLMLGVNGLYLHMIKKSMEKISGQDTLPAQLKFRVGLASVISQVGWWGAMIIGFVHRHIAHYIPYPQNPYLYMLFFVVLFVGGGFTINYSLKGK